MQTISIVDDYILRAIQRAQFEHLEDGSLTAYVPGFPGLIALGATGQACLNDLWRRLDEWLQASIGEGLHLPVIDGIDLDSEDNRQLRTFRGHAEEQQERGRFFETDEEFLAALAE